MKLKTLLTTLKREKYLHDQLTMDGLLGLVEEDPKAAYCAVSLTNTPDEAKEFVKKRQDLLKKILNEAGIASYDPGNAPLSPDLNLTATPEEVYRTDLARVAGARFFTAFDTFPSTGMGVEMEAARRYNRISVIIHDKAIRTSRMQPSGSIHIEVHSLEENKEALIKLFRLLQEYEPGRGLKEGQPVLLGFKKNETVDLAALVADKFPELQYTFEGTRPAIKIFNDKSS